MPLHREPGRRIMPGQSNTIYSIYLMLFLANLTFPKTHDDFMF